VRDLLRALSRITLTHVVLAHLLACSKPKPAEVTDASPPPPPPPAPSPLAVQRDAGAGFEGIVRLFVERPLAVARKREFTTIAVRGARASFAAPGEVAGTSAVVVADAASSRALYVRKEQRTYTIAEGAPPPEGWEVKKRGKHSVVAEHDCEEWVLSRDARKVTACVTRELPPVDVARLSTASAGAEWSRLLVANGVFPLRAEEPGALSLYVSTIVAAPQNADDFAVPEGFVELRLAKPVLPR
jgi:hypothetical protein